MWPRRPFEWACQSMLCSLTSPLQSLGSTLSLFPFHAPNNSAASNDTKLVHWQLMGGLLHLVQRRWAWVGCGSGVATGGTCPPTPIRPGHGIRRDPRRKFFGGEGVGCCQTVLSLQSHSVEPQPWYGCGIGATTMGTEGDASPPTFWLLQQ